MRVKRLGHALTYREKREKYQVKTERGIERNVVSVALVLKDHYASEAVVESKKTRMRARHRAHFWVALDLEGLDARTLQRRGCLSCLPWHS